jgi:hypothetical protein
MKIPSLMHRRRRGDLIEIWKMFNVYDESAIPEIRLSATIGFTRGHDKKLVKDDSKKMVRRHFLTNRVADDWNKLPSEVVNSSSLNMFKKSIDTKFADEMYDWAD